MDQGYISLVHYATGIHIPAIEIALSVSLLYVSKYYSILDVIFRHKLTTIYRIVKKWKYKWKFA